MEKNCLPQKNSEVALIYHIYRDDYYNKESARPGEADIIVAKQRNGPTGTVKLELEGRFAQFRDWPLSDNPYDGAPGDFAPPPPDDAGYGGPEVFGNGGGFGSDTDPGTF